MGQYYDLQLLYGYRCGVSAAAQTAKHSPAAAHDTDQHHAHLSPAANLLLILINSEFTFTVT